MPTDRGMQPSHWAKYLNQLADRIEKAKLYVRPASGLVVGDPRALRDAAQAMEELGELELARAERNAELATRIQQTTGRKPDNAQPSFRDASGIVWSLVERHEFDALVAQLQEGIDGGHRAKAELDASLDAIAGQSATRMQGHENRLDRLEDEFGKLGEWQESVDERLAELTGEIKAILERLAEQSRSQDDLHRRLLGLAKIAGPSGWGSDTMTEFVNQLTALETSVLRIETALGNVGSDTTNLSEDWRAWHHMDPVAAEEWARERAPEERPAAKRVRLTYYDEGGKNLYSVYVNRGYNTMPPGLVLQRTHRIEVS